MAFINQPTQQAWAVTDLGCATRLADEYGDVLKYCQTWGCWVVYEEGVWRREKEKDSQALVTQVCMAQLLAQPNVQSDLTSATFVRKVLFHAQALLAVDEQVFDQLLGVLNFKNGLLDLSSGALLPHRSDQYLTQQIDMNWDSDANCDGWMNHLNVMCKDDAELIYFLQRCAGMSLWGGSDRDQVFVHLKGAGRNGKGVYLRIMKKALGDYGRTAPINLLTLADGAHSTEYTTLRGARAVINSEVGAKKLNLGALKLMTGGDEVTARGIRENNVTFDNTWTLWIATNYALNTSGDSADALWERYLPIELGAMIPESDRDNAIEERLKLELEGIVRWMVEGCLAWRSEGLGIPERVRVWRSMERVTSDVFGQFMEEHFEITRYSLHKIQVADVVQSYAMWAAEHGEQLRMSSRAVARDLRSRWGLSVERGTGNRMTVFGLQRVTRSVTDGEGI